MVVNLNNISWGTRCATADSEDTSIYGQPAATKNDYFLKSSSQKLPSFSDPKEEKFWANMLSPEIGDLSSLSEAKKKENAVKMEKDLKKFR